jgi:hypothetical protein
MRPRLDFAKDGPMTSKKHSLILAVLALTALIFGTVAALAGDGVRRDVKGTKVNLVPPPGYEIVAKAVDAKSGAPTLVYLVMLYEDQSYFILQGMVRESASATFLEVFRKSARTFKKK